MLPKALLELGLTERVIADPAAALQPRPAADCVHAWREWIVTASAQRHRQVRRYLLFLKWMHATFNTIYAVIVCRKVGERRMDEENSR